MKIVICGGLGYIGTALIELYRQETEHDIIAVDKRFIPHLVAGLPPHVKYIEADVLDQSAMKPIVDGADILYQMAAEVEAEKSIHKEEAIWKNNYDAAIKLIELCSAQTRFVFPSTGNVFGGVDENEKYMDLNEEDEPRPKFPYAESKHAVEKYLFEQPDKNFTILRYGTNYGYSPGIRFNLVTNIFVKRAMQGRDITVHSSGNNFRPTVHVMDAAGGAKYLATLPEARGQIYHVIRQSYKIRELAETVVKHNPQIKLSFIDKEVPFSSYHLTNAKLRQAGYEFQFDLDSGIEQMMKTFGQIAPSPEHKIG